MKRQLYDKIENDITINKKHIDEFVLTTTSGTKKLQLKFHNNAIKERNTYIDKEINKFKKYEVSLYQELEDQVKNIYPIDNTEKLGNDKKILDSLYKTVKISNRYLENITKLGFLKIIILLDSDSLVSLYRINKLLLQFLEQFKAFGINLTPEDFNYSMFTYVYMDNFFQTNKSNDFYNVMQKKFENIYWECPELVTHLKLNIYNILNKYKKIIDTYMDNLEVSLLAGEKLDQHNILRTYNEKALEYNKLEATDAFINLSNFLNKKYAIVEYLSNSPSRIKNFNLFSSNSNYDILPDLAKISFVREIANLQNTLLELKSYYLYQNIIKDLIDKYKKKDEFKGQYEAKLKEISKEESNRIKIYKDYNKALGIGFMAKNNPDKAKVLKLQMNEEINKLNTLYNEFYDLEINVKISKNINDGSTIFNLLETSLGSFHYLKKIMNKEFGEKEGFDLEKELDKYFDFIYSYNNTFINKINATVDYDICDIVTEKYRLSSLNIVKEMITKDNIDLTLETVNYINRYNNICNGTLSIDKMYFIYNIKELEINKEKESKVIKK